MKKKPRKTTASTTSTIQPNAFGRQALLTFERIDPGEQVVLLNMLARAVKPHIPPSRLYTTKAQRTTAREMRRAGTDMKKDRERLERQRVDLRRKWNDLHNRAQLRRRGREYLTTAEQRRADALYTYESAPVVTRKKRKAAKKR
jgi:hypothetical protein